MKSAANNGDDVLSEQIAILARERKPGAWDSALTHAMIVLGRNGYDEKTVLGPAIDACKQNGCLNAENELYVRRKVKEGLAEGLKQAESLPPPPSLLDSKHIWRDMSGSTPKGTFQNAKIAIKALGLTIRYDVFHDILLIETAQHSQHVVASLVGNVIDATLIKLRHVIDEQFGFDPGDNNVRSAVQALAVQFNPVLDLIEKAQAEWDGKPRLDRMAADYFHAEDTELNSASLAKHMIASTRRVRSPGCKYDVMPVLEGPEGWNKSTAIRIIAGFENFSDAHILGVKGKEAMEQLKIVWHHECAELTGMRKAEVEVVKAFLSRQSDNHRPAYGRFVVSQPRRSVEWGTTNDQQYLVSQTGNRRFAPVKLVSPIDIEKLERDRMLLIGEAAHREQQGESLVIPEHLWGAARIEQEKRREADPWESTLANIPGSFIHLTADGKEHVSFEDVVTNILQIPAAQRTAVMGKRVAQAMEINGWQRPASPIKINGRNARGYWRYAAGGKNGRA